jgi:hypothetical protein
MPMNITFIDEDRRIKVTKTFYDCGEPGTDDQFQDDNGRNPAEVALDLVGRSNPICKRTQKEAAQGHIGGLCNECGHWVSNHHVNDAR